LRLIFVFYEIISLHNIYPAKVSNKPQRALSQSPVLSL